MWICEWYLNNLPVGWDVCLGEPLPQAADVPRARTQSDSLAAGAQLQAAGGCCRRDQPHRAGDIQSPSVPPSHRTQQPLRSPSATGPQQKTATLMLFIHFSTNSCLFHWILDQFQMNFNEIDDDLVSLSEF